jgi:small subunit ribosomal protein S16
MLSIRLSRTGKKHLPNYRIIVVEKTKDPWGDFLEILGNYNPRTKELSIKADRVNEWLSKGAQASNTVFNILVNEGIIKDDKKRVSRLSKKRKEKLTEKEKSAKAATAKKEEAKPVKDPEATRGEEASKVADPAEDGKEAKPVEDPEATRGEEAPKEEAKPVEDPEATRGEEAPKEEDKK